MQYASYRRIGWEQIYRSGVTRPEHDLLGDRDVPDDARYGVQTLRAMENFDITGIRIGHYSHLMRALAAVKQASARANLRLGLLEEEIAGAIDAACQEIIDGHWHGHFVVDVIQGGAGTSTNMNANEVIANRALELLGRERGDYACCHPNNHVNLGQSTNDVYPTAVRVALIFELEELLLGDGRVRGGVGGQSEEFADVLKMGRTQLQDAVPMTLGQEFEAFAVTTAEDIARLSETAMLFLEVNLGGTAIGTGINADPRYPEMAVGELAEITGLDFELAPNLVEATPDTGAFVSFSGVLKRVAVKLSKLCNDLRLLSSGPRCGLNEINLPAMQPGSSIMPGKVNPVIPEVVNQIAFQVIGNDLTITSGSRSRPTSTQRHGAGDHLQSLRVARYADCGCADPNRALHSRHHRQRGSLPRPGRGVDRHRHRAGSGHRLRTGWISRQGGVGERTVGSRDSARSAEISMRARSTGCSPLRQ